MQEASLVARLRPPKVHATSFTVEVPMVMTAHDAPELLQAEAEAVAAARERAAPLAMPGPRRRVLQRLRDALGRAVRGLERRLAPWKDRG